MLSASLDTSSGAAFALARDGTVAVSAALPCRGRDSDRELVPWLVELLAGAAVDIGEVERWTVGGGPGSFSGIRVGMAFVKGLCAVTRALYRSVPSSYALARAVGEGLEPGARVGVLHDARRRQLIFTAYVRGIERVDLLPEGEPEVLGAAAAVAACRACSRLVTVQPEAVALVLPEALAANVVVLDAVPADRLLEAPGWPWPAETAGCEAAMVPVYVRPAVFVKPRPVGSAQ